MKKTLALLLGLMMVTLVLAGCSAANANEDGDNRRITDGDGVKAGRQPALPEKLSLNDEGVPLLQVYQVDEEKSQEMDIETYLLGVLAGEMKNDWPMEALKAQAILARTFVLKFCTEKESKYQNADISTDIEEAQAYDATGVNERIEQALGETRGLALSYQGTFPYAWFHAHSGGVTARAKEGLAYAQSEPGYTQSVAGRESDQAPADAKEWSASFTEDEVLTAAKKAGLSLSSSIREIAVAARGESGRATEIAINGKRVSAPELRIALGSSRMRSTLLTSLKMEEGRIVMAGKGYGHGVGMPQWGAYAMAQEGMTAEEIVDYYFRDVTVEKLW